MSPRRPCSAAFCGLLCLVLPAPRALALPIEVSYVDPSGEGFFDPELGAARRSALEFAAGKWADTLAGTVPVVVVAAMPPLGGSGDAALLASAGAVTMHRNFTGGRGGTWYAAALASQLAGADLNGAEMVEISMIFNADVDGPEVMGSIGWYYGLDALPGADFDFVTTALHELGHGLGFFESVDAAWGNWRVGGDPTILERMLTRPGVGRFDTMHSAERLAAIVATGELGWSGPAVVAFNGSPVPIYAPEPFQQGSSIAHWDPGLGADELMGPSITRAIHDPGALLPALVDMGWELAVPTPTPRASPATPTPTLRPRPPAPPTPRAQIERLYVTNFDDGTVSVIDAATRKVIDTAAVGDGPIGVAAAPDGRKVYVADFRSGSLVVLSTRTHNVLATIPVGESANRAAVTPDGAFVVLTDTAADRAAIVAADPVELVARVKAGRQPSGVAVDSNGKLAFVSDYGGSAITVVDLDRQLRRAIIRLGFFSNGRGADGPLAIAIARDTALGYVASFQSRSASSFIPTTFSRSNPIAALFGGYRPQGVTLTAAGDLAYFSTYHPSTGVGRVAVVDTEADEAVANIRVGRVPEALALSRDEAFLYVANTGANSVSVVDTELGRAVASIRVGRAPMGVAVAGVPERVCAGDCDGDERVQVNELVTAVSVALAERGIVACEAADVDGDGRVSIAELVQAVSRALGDCDG